MTLGASSVFAGSETKVVGRQFRQPSRLAMTIHKSLHGFRFGEEPHLWIHGYTHESFDYEIGKTRVVCNPRGYASIEENKGFRPDFTVEI